MPDQWDINPSLSNTVAQGGVADEMAGSTYSGAAQSVTAGDVAFGGPTADFILYGVVNGAFAQGPPDPASNIEPVNNPMPYWSGPTQVSGGAITCQWVVDASSPSGYNLRFTMNPGAASDEAYVEQIVPINGDRGRISGILTRIYCLADAGNTGTFNAVSRVQYLTVSGSATGAENTQTSSVAAGGTKLFFNQFPTSVPADAAYARLRIGVQRIGAAGELGTIDFAGIRVDMVRLVSLLGDLTNPAANAPGVIYQDAGVMYITPAGNTARISSTLSVSGIDLGSSTAVTDTTLSRASAGVVSIEGGTTSGLQVSNVAFPATDNPSADANTLDDYEEGAFTPAITFATVGNLNVVYSTQVGTYTKIGRLVNLRIQIATSTFTHTTAAGEFRITGLPFTPVSTFFNQLLMNGWTKANYTYTCGDCQAGITYVRVLASGSGQAVAVFAVGDLPTGGTINIRLGGFFYV